MSSEFTKHFGNTRILGGIMGGWNSKLPMEILQEKHPSRPFKCLPKNQRIPRFCSFGIFVALQSFSSWWSLKLQQIVMSIRDGPPLSHTYCWVIEIWRSKKKQFEVCRFCSLSHYLRPVWVSYIDFWSINSSCNPLKRPSVDPFRPWGSHPPGALRLLPRRCAKYKCCWQEWKLDHSREALSSWNGTGNWIKRPLVGFGLYREFITTQVMWG